MMSLTVFESAAEKRRRNGFFRGRDRGVEGLRVWSVCGELDWRSAEGSVLRTRASDAGWLNGNISKRAVDLVPCSRSAPLLSQISSSFCLISHPFPSNSFFENMRHRCIQNSLLPVPIEYILVQRVLRPAEAVACRPLRMDEGRPMIL